MWDRRTALVLVSVLSILGGGGMVWAAIDNLKSYKQAYPGKDAKTYTCKTCHQGAIGKKGDLNAYGQSLQ